jgi:hypothetical protein
LKKNNLFESLISLESGENGGESTFGVFESSSEISKRMIFPSTIRDSISRPVLGKNQEEDEDESLFRTTFRLLKISNRVSAISE